MSDDKMPEVPRSFLEEIKDVLGDVLEDYNHTILGTDQEVHTFYRQQVINLMSSGRDPNLIIDDFATAFVWMILLGREHALRGFASPFARQDVEGADLISDDQIARMIREELGK